jgi:predicted DNA-binding protein
MKRTNFYFPEPMLKRLKKASAKMEVPISEIIRRAIDEWLAKHGF